MTDLQRPLTFMTLNLGSGIADPHRVVSVIRTSQADIVALQELAPADTTEIERTLGDAYPYQALHPLGIPGKGLLSRYPLSGAELVPFHPGRPDLIATIELPEKTLRVIVAHPPPPRIRPSQRYENELRFRQIDQLIEVATAEQGTILLGDFNMLPWQADYHRITGAGLVDAFRAVGGRHGATLPRRLQIIARSKTSLSRVTMPPFMRVDYILHTPDLLTLGARRGAETGSDHLPVLADIQIPNGTPLIVTPSATALRLTERELSSPEEQVPPPDLVLPGARPSS